MLFPGLFSAFDLIQDVEMWIHDLDLGVPRSSKVLMDGLHNVE